jgi:hypothetical protein
MVGFRSAKGSALEWLPTGIQTGFSNFRFIDERFHSSPVLRRLFSLARKLGYESLVIEEIDEAACDLFEEETAALAIREPRFQQSRVFRLLFLKCPPDSVLEPDDLLGYAVFKEDYFRSETDPRFHVYEAVMTPFRQASVNNFIHCARFYDVESAVGTLYTKGVLYAQQNDLTFVCAHVALRTALASILPEADISYARINKLIGVDHAIRKVGNGVGLSPDDMEAIAKGCAVPHKKIIHEPGIAGLALPGDFQRDLYGFIESGQPALLGFEFDGSPSRHIIPVIGHTFNEDTWVAESARSYFDGGLKYFPSENWLSTYVVHDDNFGPYYCLPRHYLKKENFRIVLGLQRHETVIQAVDAEAVALVYLNAIAGLLTTSDGGWLERFKAFADADLLVLRPLLIHRDEYLTHLSACGCWSGMETDPEAIEKVRLILPEWLWMVEASAPELFSATRRKFGEVLIRADLAVPKPMDISLLLGLRLPGQFLNIEGQTLQRIDTGTTAHVALFQFSSVCRG